MDKKRKKETLLVGTTTTHVSNLELVKAQQPGVARELRSQRRQRVAKCGVRALHLVDAPGEYEDGLKRRKNKIK